MVNRDIIRRVFIQGLPYSKDLADIAAPLKAIGVTDFSYIQLKNKNRTIRISSNVNYAHHYLARLNDYSEKSFYEKNPRAHNKAITTSEDCRKLYEHNEVLQDMKAHGLGEWIYLKHENYNQTTDIFGFYANEENGVKKLATHLESLNLFALHLKDQGAKLLSKATVPEHSLKINVSRELNTNIQNYHLGYPFKTYLTSQEFLCVQLFYQGFSLKEIAQELYLPYLTIEKILKSLYKKTGSHNQRTLQKSLLNCPIFTKIMNPNLLVDL